MWFAFRKRQLPHILIADFHLACCMLQQGDKSKRYCFVLFCCVVFVCCVHVLVPLTLQSCESGMATPGDLESAYADALQRNERGGVHLLRLIQKTGPVWPQLSATTCTGLMEVQYRGCLLLLWGRDAGSKHCSRAEYCVL